MLVPGECMHCTRTHASAYVGTVHVRNIVHGSWRLVVESKLSINFRKVETTLRFTLMIDYRVNKKKKNLI